MIVQSHLIGEHREDARHVVCVSHPTQRGMGVDFRCGEDIIFQDTPVDIIFPTTHKVVYAALVLYIGHDDALSIVVRIEDTAQHP